MEPYPLAIAAMPIMPRSLFPLLNLRPIYNSLWASFSIGSSFDKDLVGKVKLLAGS